MKALLLILAMTAIGYTLVSLTPPVSEMSSGKVLVQRVDPRTGKEVPVFLGPGVEGQAWTPLSKVSRFFLDALVVSEDSRFYQHFGVDFREILVSALTNLQKGKYARGASTITQQLVRLVFLTREKTILRKLREALGALVLEWVLGKDEILEWYVNLVPLGPTTYGIAAASQVYFNTEAELLNVPQSILLVMVIPGPSLWTPIFQKRRLSELGQKKFAKIANELFASGSITSAQYQKALASGNFGAPVQ